MASIKKKKNKNGQVSWEITYELGKDPLSDKRIRKSETVKGTKKQALAVMEKKRWNSSVATTMILPVYC